MTQAETNEQLGLPDKSSIHSWPMLRDLIKREAIVSEDGITLANGKATTTYLNIPGVLQTGTRVNTAAVTILSWLELNGVPPNTVSAFGGPSFGAAPLAISIASLGVFAGGFMYKWFSVRRAPKDHGLPYVIDGAVLGPKDRVVLLDDVVNTGESLRDAYQKVIHTGAEVAAVIPLVDRSGKGESIFRDELRVLYRPLFMYFDLDLQPL
jgi:orotate phosphoribosyltransferase